MSHCRSSSRCRGCDGRSPADVVSQRVTRWLCRSRSGSIRSISNRSLRPHRRTTVTSLPSLCIYLYADRHVFSQYSICARIGSASIFSSVDATRPTCVILLVIYLYIIADLRLDKTNAAGGLLSRYWLLDVGDDTHDTIDISLKSAIS